MSPRTTLLSIATVCIACATSFSAADKLNRVALKPLGQDKSTGISIPNASYFELADIQTPDGLPAQTTIQIPIGGAVYDVNLYRFSMRSADFELLVDDGRQLNVTEPTEGKTYRGTVNGINESTARASLLPGGFFGCVDLGDDLGKWFIQPIHSFEEHEVAIPADMSRDMHVIYQLESVFLPGYQCGNDFFDMDRVDKPQPENDGQGGFGGLAGATIYYIEVGLDSDYEFYQRNGNNVENTVDDMELIYNLVENVYEDDVSINFELSTIIVRSSSSDPYSGNDADDILCQFRNQWNTGAEDDIRRDVAQIFTGKNVTGNVLGLAWLGVVCNQNGFDCGGTDSLAYGMCESKYTSGLTNRMALHAHELGHNFNADHCDASSECRIMCSANICDFPNRFAPVSISTINSFRAGLNCDTTLGDEITLPFFEDFTLLSSSIWPYNKGGSRSSAADNEPSPSTSLQLDSTGSGTYADDEIRSQTMLASGFDPMYISFYTQHKGVESGKSLIVEYYNSASTWVELTEIVSNGSNQTEFAFHEFEMGSDAKTNRFRIRFRTNGTSSTDDWYIDDLEIDDSPADPPVDPPANDDCLGAQLIEAGITTFSTVGATATEYPLPASCDEGNGSTMGADVWFQYIAAPCSGTVTISTCGNALLDTRIAVYNGVFGCPYEESHLVACNDDNAACGDDALIFTSSESIPIFYIRVGNQNGDTADNLQLFLSCEPDEEPCEGDFNEDGLVDGADLAVLLGAWGTISGDLNDDGTTDGADLSIVLGNWGDC